MPDLMAHDKQNLLVLHILQDRVVKHDALGAEEPRDVRVVFLALFGRVDLENITVWNTGPIGERQKS
jgi:hypothetical protein